MDSFNGFVELLKKVVKNKEITLDTELRALGIDSLDLAEIIMEAEEKFNVSFSNDELNGFVKVQDVVKTIDSKKKK
jgi:acyl carrier protein